jgi:hypothetical protein
MRFSLKWGLLEYVVLMLICYLWMRMDIPNTMATANILSSLGMSFQERLLRWGRLSKA